MKISPRFFVADSMRNKAVFSPLFAGSQQAFVASWCLKLMEVVLGWARIDFPGGG
jgi:hypothetical protein